MPKRRLDFNAPVILSMTFFCFAVVLIDMAVAGGKLAHSLGVAYTSWRSPLMYLRLFTHVLAHANLAHFTGNFMLILAVGPSIEEKYGSRDLVVMIALTSLITGLINVLFFKNILLMGASGVVFMLIILASFVNVREGKFPLTVILVAVLFIGNEIVSGVLARDNISQLAHIVGGLLGGCFGLVLHGDKIRKRKKPPKP